MGRGGGMSCTESWSFQCAEPHSSFPPRGAGSLHGRHEHVSFWMDQTWPCHAPQHLPSHPLGDLWTSPLSPSWIPQKYPERAEKRFPRGSKGQVFSLGQEFGLGLPRKGGGLQVGCTAASQEREHHQAGPQQVATVTAIIVH